VSTSYYRLTVVACALSWFMVGLHVPALHRMTHHGGTPSWTVLAIMSLLAAAAVAGLWILLRSPARRAA
jgi:hypothetical protein